MMHFDHIYKEDQPTKTTPAAKKVLALLFLLFLVLFKYYLPYEHKGEPISSTGGYLFAIYFFIFEQTLGIVHEGGHGICYLFHCPQFITTLNGTIFQLLFPLGIMYYYRRKKNNFSAYIALFFVGFSLLYTAWYISTTGQGPIVSAANSFLGEEGYHDFYLILNSLGLLSHYESIAAFTKITSYLIMYYAVLMLFFEGFILIPDKREKATRNHK